jgi:hypothetical protein
MYISKIFLIPFLFLENVSSGKSLNHYEYLITKSVMINFEIRHCIIVGVNDNVTVLKKFSSQNIISITKSLKGLLEYLKKGSFVNVETMVVMKEKNLGNLTEIFQILKEVNFFLNRLKDFFVVDNFFFSVEIETSDSSFHLAYFRRII